MSLRALLMRVFLIVALLANGPGIAGAAMHMDHLRDSAGDVTSVAAAQTRSEAMAACNGTATPPVADDHSHPRPADLVDAQSLLGDCCQAGDSRACLPLCCTALAASTLRTLPALSRTTADPLLSTPPPP